MPAGWRRIVPGRPAAAVWARRHGLRPATDHPLDAPSVPPQVVLLGPVAWTFRRQRPHQLAGGLAGEGIETAYVSPTDFVAGPGSAAGRDVAPHLTTWALGVQRRPHLYLEAPDSDELRKALRLLVRDEGERTVLGVMLPSWGPLASELADRTGALLWYDCMDHWAGFPDVGRDVLRAETALVRRADVVTVTSGWLAERWGADRAVHRLPNAFDPSLLQLASEAEAPSTRGGPAVVVYTGAIASWFDADALVLASQAVPEARFVLVGRVEDDRVGATLRGCANVELRGEQPWARAVAAVASADLCIAPFRRSPLADATDPVKVYEYVALGKPVVTLGLPETAGLHPRVRPAADAAEFASVVRDWARELPAATPDADTAFRAANTWNRRVERCRALLGLSPSRT